MTVEAAVLVGGKKRDTHDRRSPDRRLAPHRPCRLQARSEIRKKLEQCAAHSDFVQMAELLDEEGPLRQSDTHGFEHAQNTYAELEKEAQWLEAGGLTDPVRVQASARVSAAISAAFLASGVLAAFTVAMVL